ncbi:helix-turn-helix transcriptional regulator [Parvularcula sp. IMCC14364]|uniref:helix-turn-helix transcriptional regulator n=1 Tax=Parvularcula sp. IMCC14364 TaxID=3067902 RepID=UPI002740853B|nr:helix-turn-helix transcriptional regulator [Parvularcula sp. IMCC14364]
MAQNPDYNLAPAELVESDLCARLAEIRLSQNINQTTLAKEAGVARRTISRLENGEGVSFETIIRVMRALGLTSHLKSMLPDPKIRPIDRVKFAGQERKHASSPRKEETADTRTWQWGDEKDAIE